MSENGRAALQPAGPSYAELEASARLLLKRARRARVEGAQPTPSAEWRAAFAGARAAVSPPQEEAGAVAAFGLRLIAGRERLLVRIAEEPLQLARARTLAAAVVGLRSRGQAGIATALAALVAGMTGDRALPPLLPLFVCLEAMVHCRLAQQLGAGGFETPAAFWRLALDEAHSASHPRLVLCCGLSGSGKSYVANGIACELGARVVASDPLRKALAGLLPTERTPAERLDEVYAAELSARVYARLTEEAEADLRAGFPVVLDATYLKADHRRRPLEVAQHLGVPAAVVFCRLDDREAHARLARRLEEAWNVSEADEQVRARQRTELEAPVDGEAGAKVLSVDTALAPAALFEALLPRLSQALRAK